jgi:hypothetical protein
MSHAHSSSTNTTRMGQPQEVPHHPYSSTHGSSSSFFTFLTLFSKVILCQSPSQIYISGKQILLTLSSIVNYFNDFIP